MGLLSDSIATQHRKPDERTHPEILIRPARPEDANPASELIYLPMGKMADYLFGSDNPSRAKEVFCRLFKQEGSRFSYRFSDVLEANHEIAGLLVGYPGNDLKRMDLPMAKQLYSIFGWRGMWRFLRRSVPLMRYKETERDEFYIFTLAIKPGFQDNGLGSRLLTFAMEKARKLSLAKCSLGVDINNVGAIHFYETNGFRIVETVQVPSLEHAFGYPGYHRMVKVLSASG
jgi:ribosomal protein S18 acetylase RimI-like enzyme